MHPFHLKGSFHQQAFMVAQCFEVVLRNMFHKGCLSVGNVRHEYTSRVVVLSSKANWSKTKMTLSWQTSTRVHVPCGQSRVQSERRAKKDYGGRKRWQITDSGSTFCQTPSQHEPIDTVVAVGGAACWGQPGGSCHTAAGQEHKNSDSHRSTGDTSDPVVMSRCDDTTLKAPLLRQQPWRTFDTVAADLTVCIPVTRADWKWKSMGEFLILQNAPRPQDTQQ